MTTEYFFFSIFFSIVQYRQTKSVSLRPYDSGAGFFFKR